MACEAPPAKAAKSCNDWPKLTLEECQAKMGSVGAWDLLSSESDGVLKLERSFIALNFQSALDFVAAAGAVAEQRNHHPDLHITGYRNVRIVVYSHGLSGLTENDFLLCEAIDASAKIKYSPKFIKENTRCAYTSAVAEGSASSSS